MRSKGWKRIKLDDVLDALIDYRGKTPKKKTYGIPLITAKIVKEGFVQEPTEFIAENEYSTWMVRGLPQVGDVVLTVEAPLGQVAQLRSSHVALAQRIVTLRGKRDILDNGYLKYFLQSDIGQARLKERETGTTVTGIKQSELRLIEIDLPPFSVQKRIASILSSLDDKIEVNRKTNQTLEDIAQAIFKEWFVDFNFPGAKFEIKGSELGTIPTGWSINSFEEQLDAERGLSYKGSGLVESNAMPMHNLNSICEGGGYKIKGIKYYNGVYRDKHIINPGDLIIANTEQGHKYLLIGYPAIIPSFFGDKGIFSHHIYRLRAKTNSYLTSEYLYQLLLLPEIREQIIGFANGTTVNMLKIEGLQKPKFIVPPEELVLKYSKIASSFRSNQEENLRQNQILAQLRDILLPKLMKGEIPIPEVEKQISAVI